MNLRERINVDDETEDLRMICVGCLQPIDSEDDEVDDGGGMVRHFRCLPPWDGVA